MKPKTLTLAMTAVTSVTAVVLVSAAGYGLYTLGVKRGMADPATTAPAAAGTMPSAPKALPQNIAEGEEATRRHITSIVTI